VSEAEGKAAAQIKIAEAEKQAVILRAQGRAKALALIAEAESNYLEALQKKRSDRWSNASADSTEIY